MENNVMQYPLVRFVADGLRDTIASFGTGELPLHRLSWELHTRIESLSEFAGRRSLAELRSWQRYVEALDTVLRETGREGLTAHEEHTLAGALVALRDTLDKLDPPATAGSGSPISAGATSARPDGAAPVR
ncbi:hypothetical protein [Pseudonocardia acaciae]|uniref:hypothetical protein n=1 Tax=Pseudonocardia acaciae TaxID=551276 RepID=UPI00049101D7|nr:hypothetical protein [Pseudonocardia acaciae]